MKKVIFFLICLMSIVVTFTAIAAETGNQVYYGTWSEDSWTEKNPAVYCGWWSAISIVNISNEPQEVNITVYSFGNKYKESVIIDGYDVYAIHIQDMMKNFGYELLAGSFIVKVENTLYTYSVFLIHNGSHSYTQ